MKLSNSVTNVAISKIQKPVASLVFSFEFRFSCPYSKANGMQVRAPILEAVRGGESALAMAKRRYDTVHFISEKKKSWNEKLFHNRN